MDVLNLCKCENCPMNGSKKILGEGTSTTSQYNLVFVGIAPAKTEMRMGRPLVGWSGTLLRKVLTKLGIEDFYLTNSMLCQLPETVKDSEKSRISDEATKCCNERLLEEVRSCNPKLVVAMGNVPLEALTGIDYKIRSVQGRVLPGLVCPVLPVIHPASLAKRSEEFYDLVDSLKSGIRFLDGTYQQAIIPKKVIVDGENLPEAMQVLDNAEMIAVDLETTATGFYPYSREPDLIRCACLAVDDRTAYIFPAKSSPYFEPHPDFVYGNEQLKELLSKKKLIFHNGPFDVGFLKQAGYDVKIFFDTMLAHYLIDERQYSHGLKDLAGKYLGAPDWEADIKKYLPHKASSYDLIPDDALYEYAAYDVVYTYQLSEGQGFREQMENSFPYKNILIPCSNMFAEIRHRGISVDVGLLMDMDDILEKELEKHIEILSDMVGRTVNVASPPDVASLLYDALGYPQIPGFGRSTAARVLRLIGGEICDKIIEIREFAKLKSTYVVGIANFLDHNFRIHPMTRLTGTVTGRLSATEPSFMNVSASGGVRRLYIPDIGKLMLEADNKQMELRCYSITAPDPYCKQLLLDGEDPHGIVHKNLAAGTEYASKWSAKEGRTKAKAAVFGRLYGRGKKDMMINYGLSEQVVNDLIATIDRTFPAVKQYLDRVKKEIHSKGVLTSYFGRKRHFGLILDENKHECYRQGSNFYIQSMASDLNLLGMLRVWELKDELGVYPFFPVHDSIVMQIDSMECLPKLKKVLEDYEEELVNHEIRFNVECAVGPAYQIRKEHDTGEAGCVDPCLSGVTLSPGESRLHYPIRKSVRTWFAFHRYKQVAIGTSCPA